MVGGEGGVEQSVPRRALRHQRRTAPQLRLQPPPPKVNFLTPQHSAQGAGCGVVSVCVCGGWGVAARTALVWRNGQPSVHAGRGLPFHTLWRAQRYQPQQDCTHPSTKLERWWVPALTSGCSCVLCRSLHRFCYSGPRLLSRRTTTLTTSCPPCHPTPPLPVTSLTGPSQTNLFVYNVYSVYNVYILYSYRGVQEWAVSSCSYYWVCEISAYILF